MTLSIDFMLIIIMVFVVITHIINWFIFFRIFKVLNKNKENAILHRNEIIKGINHIIDNQ